MPPVVILSKLKGLVRPLLERVLRFATNRLPVAVKRGIGVIGRSRVVNKLAGMLAKLIK